MSSNSEVSERVQAVLNKLEIDEEVMVVKGSFRYHISTFGPDTYEVESFDDDDTTDLEMASEFTLEELRKLLTYIFS